MSVVKQLSDHDIHILDRRLFTVFNSGYPNEAESRGIQAMIKYFYTVTNRAPRVKDFSTVASEEKKRCVSAPVLVRGPDRDQTQDLVINRFFAQMFGRPTFESAFDEADFRTKDFSHGTMFCHCVTWKLDKDVTFKALLKAFYKDVKVVYSQDFMFCGDYEREQGFTVCSHPVEDLPLDQKTNPSVDAARKCALQQHATACMRKALVEGTRPDRDADSLWHQPTTTVRSEVVDDAKWRKEHPYFSACPYNKSGFIPINKTQLATLPPKMAELYPLLQKNKLTSDQIVGLKQEMVRIIRSLHKEFTESGADMGPLSFCNHLSMSEMFRICTVRPVQRPLVVKCEVKQDKVNFAIGFRGAMYLISCTKTVTRDSDILLAIKYDGNPTIFNLINSAKASIPIIFHTDKKLVAIRGRQCVETFLSEVAKLGCIPYNYTLSTFEPVDNSKQFEFLCNNGSTETSGSAGSGAGSSSMTDSTGFDM
jgi:hypothetical protein